MQEQAACIDERDELGEAGQLIWGFPKIRGYLFGGPIKKDYSILGSILGSPYFGKLPSLHPHNGPVLRLRRLGFKV